MEASTTPNDNVDLERRKVEIEEKKLEIELEKLKVEKTKAWAGNTSIIASLLIGAITISFGIWNQSEQAKTQLVIQEQQAKSQFELKAAEIVMNTTQPKETYKKAKALLNLFPNRLPEQFAQSFNPEEYQVSASVNAYAEGISKP